MTALPHPAARTGAERDHHAWLRANRPDLAERFTAALPGARAAVLARLWGAIVREPLPGSRPAAVSGPLEAAQPFAVAPAGLTVGGRDHPADLAADLWPDRPAFAAEIDNSVANLALARTADHRDGSDDLADAEQSILDGHPLHPCCRTRTGMTAADVLAYAPEHRPTVELPVIAVPPRAWTSTGAGLAPRLVLHPWQWARERAGHRELTDTGERHSARPLMSLRTLAVNDVHVKTAVSATMTSATRTVSAAALHNGPVLSAFLATVPVPGLEMLAERAGGAVLVDGEPSRHLAMVVRDAPRLRAGERALPVAALTAGRPAAEDLIGGGDPATFLAGFTGLLLPPLLALLARGVALEAHGQNLVLVTANGRPHRLLYRDFGGVRISPAELKRHGIEAPPLRGDIPCDDPDELAAKVLASAVTTVLGGLVAHLARRYGVEPARLWAALARRCPAWLRERDALPVKALTAMRLADSVDDVWSAVPNPLADAQ